MFLKSTILLLLFSVAIQKAPNQVNKLVKTQWNSSFYLFFANYYAFLTQKEGFTLRSQVARSCPVDTLALGISGDKYIYSDTLFFGYTLKDSFLIIEYSPHVNEAIDTFIYRPSHNRWKELCLWK